MNRKFLMAVGVFLVFVFLLQWDVPARFVWQPTFAHDDPQPLGCQVFDSLMGRSLKAGYRVTDKTLPRLARERWRRPHAILIQTTCMKTTPTDLKALCRLLEAGHHVLIATGEMADDTLSSFFGVTIRGATTVIPWQVRQSFQNLELLYDTLRWLRQPPYPERSYRIFSAFVDGGVWLDNHQDCDTLLQVWQATDTDTVSTGYWKAALVAKRWRRGTIYFCSTPLLLTNYGALDPQIHPLLFRILSQTRGLPVVRTEAYTPHTERDNPSPLGYFLRQPPLRRAIYLSLAGLLLFCVFFARRRQRVIPMVKAPENKSLEFVRLIGTLYYQRHDNRDLLRKKYAFFADTLRARLLIDLEDHARRPENITTIARQTGLEKAAVQAVLDQTKRMMENQTKIADADLRRAIDRLDEISSKL